jgi:membrane-associated phospholipid phosphatase
MHEIELGDDSMSVDEKQSPPVEKQSSDGTSMTCCASFLALLKAYWGDWVSCLFLVVVGGLPQIAVSPPDIPWSLEDPSLHNAIQSNTIPSEIMFALYLGVVVFLIVLLVVVPARVQNRTINTRYLHHALLGWFMQFGIALMFQGTMSVTMGGLRPDFYARCNPILPWTRGTMPVCQSGDLDEGRRSFPSGHASFTMGSGLFFSLLLVGATDALNGDGYVWKHIVWLAPTLGSILIGVTRMRNARHHGRDVLIGFIVGAFAAVFAYWNYFHSLWGAARGYPRCSRDTIGMPAHLVNADTRKRPVPPQHE